MAKYTKEMEYNELAKRGECFCATSNCGGYGIVVNAGGDADCGDVIVWTRNTRRKGGKKLNTRFQETRRQRRVLISRCTVPVIISITS